MFNKKIILGLCALFMAQVIFAGGGGDCNTVQSGNWSDSATWSCGGASIPGNEYTVTIETGHTVLLDVDTAGIGFLLVEAGGDLNVMASVNGLSINANVSSSSSTGIDLSQASIELFGDLTINADDRVIKLGSVIGQFGLTLNSTGEARLMGKIGDNSSNSPTSLTTDAAGTTIFDIPNGGVNSPNLIVYGPRIFNDNVLLLQFTHIKGTSGAITFNGTIDTAPSVGVQDLVFSFINNVTLSFNEDVGEIKNLGDILMFNSSGASIEINTAQINTYGKIAFSENIILNSPTGTVSLYNSNPNTSRFIGLGNSSSYIRSANGNPNSLLVQSMGSIQINGDIGDDTFPIINMSMDATAGITINSTAISTTGIQTFIGDIVLGSDVIMTAQNVNITDNINNAGFDLTLNLDETVSTISGVLSGAGNLNKSGSGDLVFSSQSTQTGNVILNEGKLINNSLVADLFTAAPIISLAPGTTAQIGVQLLGNTFDEVNLQTDQMLIGSGFCDSRLNVLDGKVSPGFNSNQIASRLSINNMVMNSQSELIIQLNGTSSEGGYDQVIVDGATLNGATLSLSLGFIPDIGDTFKILDVTGPPPVTGLFDGLANGGNVFVDNTLMRINYDGGDGNDVVLTVLRYTRFYVNENAAAMGDGLTWATAFDNLQDALAAAIEADIWVAAGVYYPDEGGLQADGDRSASFTLQSEVLIYGGFDGTETTLSQRNPALNVTILSGDIDQDDTNNDGNFIAEGPGHINGDNSYHILNGSNVNIGTIIDGFTVTAGLASNPSNNNNKGAGMFCGNNTSGPAINQLVFIGNLSLSHAAATFGCSQSVSNTSYINNHGNNSGAVLAMGGVFDNVTFSKNQSTSPGGAIRNNGNLLTIKNSIFMANKSSEDGGAIYSSANVVMENALFRGNKSPTNNGGALFLGNNVTADLTNVTMTGNFADKTGGAIGMTATSVLNIQNSIIWNNDLDDVANNSPTRSIEVPAGAVVNNSYSLIQNFGITGMGNLDTDPFFITATNPSAAPTTLGNSHLQSGSLAINAGENTLSNESVDLDGSQRIQDTTVDMGAYEFSSHVISVAVTGLGAGILVLQNNGGDDLTFNTDDTLQFSTNIANTADYLVTVLNQPTTPNQQCVISNGSATIAAADVTVDVVCTTLQYKVTGELFGLDAGDVFLLNNAGDALELSANGIFEFATALDDLSPFVVTVNTNPSNPSQSCLVSGGNSGLDDGTGSLAGTDYSGIVVTCTTNTYLIGGTVTGLNSGQQLRLRYEDGVSLNLIEDLVLNQNADYTFNSVITDLGQYHIEIIGQPSNQTCELSNVSGTINGANVTNINATCRDYVYKVGGELFGLGAGSISLKNNSDDEITLTTNAVFQFPTAIADEADYGVSISVQPTNPNQVCVVTGGNSGLNDGTGILNTADDNSIVVTCTTNQYFVSGMASGLAVGNSVSLSLGAEDLSVTSNAAFVFLNPLADESDYSVLVSSQPAAPNQTCSLINPVGIIAGNDVTDIEVNCITNQYMIGGTVTGLHSGNNLLLQNNGGDDLMLASDGNFDFVTDIEDLLSYDVSILNQPSDPIQTCVISNNTGNVAGIDVTTVSIVCVFGDDLIFGDDFE